MRISADTVSETKQTDTRRSNDKKTSDRFSQLMKSKKEQSREQQHGNKGDAAPPKSSGSQETASSQSANVLGVNDPTSRVPELQTADIEKTAQSGAGTAFQVEKLATEIGQQIDLVKQAGKTEGVNITFDSKTLEGLQVQIRQQDGEMAIRFVTQSENVSNLLSRHTGELTEALTGKGVKIRNISIGSHGVPVMRRNGYAGD